MVSDPLSDMANGGNALAEIPVSGSISNKKSPRKVPKKIHKAEREKRKRDHLNDLFVELGHALEPARQNNGKASILGDASRFLRDLMTQIESLRKEHDTLLTESRYITTEKNELRDENTVLESEISRLHHALREKTGSNPMWCNGSDKIPTLPPTSTALPSVAPLYVVPLQGPHSEAGTAPSPAKPNSQVRRPHARYPTPSDSWPLELLLSRNPRPLAEDAQHHSASTSTSTSASTTSSTSTSAEDSSDKSLTNSTP